MDKKILFGIIGLILLAGGLVALWFAMSKAPKTNPAAEIRQNGELIRTVSLSEDAEFTIECEDGYNTITIAGGAISVTAADCPDKVCVRTGAVSGGSIPIVCLPHRLEIIVINGSDEIDARV